MERIQTPGEIATAYSLAQMLSSIPLTRTGPCEVVIFDIHALQNQFYFSSNIIVRLESTVELLLDELNNRKNQNEKFAMAFPDDGAHKRFAHMFEENKYPIVVCSKIREGDKRITTIKEGNPSGYHCIIIDDLVQSGGTLMECAQALLKMGATNVSAFVGHGIFPNESWKKFVHSNNPEVHFDTFYVTNTYPNTQVLIDKPPFKRISFLDKHLQTFSFFDEDEYLTRDISKHTANLLWFQLYHDVLFELTHDEDIKQEMIGACRLYYRDNITELEFIDKFENEYRPKEAVK
ncbi:unnamed protein product, partial [Rotaria sp. Silwood2]